MISLILIWLVLSLLCLCLGTAIVTLLKVDLRARLGDRIILAEWIGILAFSQIALLTSLITAIQLPIAITLVLGTIGLSILLKPVRQTIAEGIEKLRDFTWTEWLKWGAVFIILAALQTREARLYDTGAYHYPMIQWLNQFGTVPGLALIHLPFGYNAAWLALSSVFNQSILSTRSASIINGFIDALVISQVILIGQRILDQRDKVSDWFMLIALPTLWIGFIWIFTTSYSPDYVVAVSTQLIGWIMLFQKYEGTIDSSQKADRREWIILMISILSCGIKLNAIPLGITGFLYFIQSRSWNTMRIIQGLGLTIICLLPSILYGIKTSGCPAFPSNLLCLNTPWSYSSEELADFRQTMVTFNRWSLLNPPNPESWYWMVDSVIREPQYLLQFLASMLASYFLWIVGAFRARETKLLAGMAGMGIILAAVMSPLWRFCVGYLTVIPALGFALWVERSSTGHRKLTRLFQQLHLKIFYAIWSLAIVSVLIVNKTTPDRIVLPPLVQGPGPLVIKSDNEIEYQTTQNGDDLCWTAPIPCTPKDLKSVQFANPTLGLKEGFIRSK